MTNSITLKQVEFSNNKEIKARRSMVKASTELALLNNHIFLAAKGYSNSDDMVPDSNDPLAEGSEDISQIMPKDVFLRISDFSNYLINPLQRKYATI